MGSTSPVPGPADVAFAAWLKRRGSPEADSFHSLLQAHPQHVAELRALHEQWQRWEPMLRLAGFDPTAPASFAERLRAAHGSDVDPAVSLDAPPSDLGKASSDLLKRLGKKSTGSRYRLEGEVARGGMGAILRVWDEDIRRHLAMKVVLGKGDPATTDGTPAVDPSQLARFLEEAQVTGQLDHPGIVPVHELGIDEDGRVFFTMKLVKGRDLKSIYDLVFEGKDGWNETRALTVLLKVCEAVAYAHKKGVIHRDLKPSNVMVGDFGEVYVMDWGLARVAGRKDQRDIRIAPVVGGSSRSVRTERREEREDTPDSPIVTMDGDVVGTPAYMSIEQARGEIQRLDERSDVYSIGSMLYHLLTRQAPYTSPGERVSNRTVYARLLDGPPKPIRTLRQNLSAELEAVCEMAMMRDAANRYRDTSALADDLRAYLERRVVRAYETGAFAEAKKWVLRNKLLTASALLALLVAAGGSTWIGTQNVQLRRANTLAADKTAEAESSAARARASEQDALRLRNAALARERHVRIRGLAQDIALLDSLDNDVVSVRDQPLPAWEWWIREASQLIDGSGDGLTTPEDWKPGLADVVHARSEIGTRAIQVPQPSNVAPDLPAAGRLSRITFSDPQDQWADDVLAAIEYSLERLSERLAAVHQSATTAVARQTWDVARKSILNSPLYVGLRVPIQCGLLPIGADPVTGLWEFVDIETGSIPDRASSGTLIITAESGVVYVLLPSDEVPVEHGRQGTSINNVVLDPFFLSKYELTRAQGQRIANYSYENSFRSRPNAKTYDTAPLQSFNISDEAFVPWTRLPTSAEWEYACRAGTRTPWWTGASAETLPGSEHLRFDPTLSPHPLPVGSLQPNPFGFYDMHGNVPELCVRHEPPDELLFTGDSAFAGQLNTPNTDRYILCGGSVYWPVRQSVASSRSRLFGAGGVRLARSLLP